MDGRGGRAHHGPGLRYGTVRSARIRVRSASAVWRSSPAPATCSPVSSLRAITANSSWDSCSLAGSSGVPNSTFHPGWSASHVAVTSSPECRMSFMCTLSLCSRWSRLRPEASLRAHMSEVILRPLVTSLGNLPGHMSLIAPSGQSRQRQGIGCSPSTASRSYDTGGGERISNMNVPPCNGDP